MDLTLGGIRQILYSFIYLKERPESIDLSLDARICQMEKLSGYMSASLVQTLYSLIPSKMFGKEMEMIFFHIFRFPLFESGLLGINLFLKLIEEFSEDTIWDFALDLMTLYTFYTCDILDSFGKWIRLNPHGEGLGRFVGGVSRIFRRVAEKTNRAVVYAAKFLMDLLEMGVGTIVEPDSSSVKSLLGKILKGALHFFTKHFLGAPMRSLQFVQFILRNVPVVGEYLLPMVQGICGAVEVIADHLEDAANAILSIFDEEVDFGLKCKDPSLEKAEKEAYVCEDEFCAVSIGSCAEKVDRDSCPGACQLLMGEETMTLKIFTGQKKGSSLNLIRLNLWVVALVLGVSHLRLVIFFGILRSVRRLV